MSEIIVQNNSKDKCFSFGSLFVGSTGETIYRNINTNSNKDEYM